MSGSRISSWLAAAVLLSGCTIDKGRLFTGVPTQEQAEIRVAIRAVTKSPVTGFSRRDDAPRNFCYVYTADRKTWRAIKFHGKWYFEEAIIVLNPIDLTRRFS
ncbi:MAG: hypothetical protein QOG67_595 [Verrucomicrobiota bacterium]|jgi:hypothetical protein